MTVAIIFGTLLGGFALRLFISSNVLIALMVIIFAGLGYYQFSYVPAQRAAEQSQGN